MLGLPLVSLIFLILIYRIHKFIFWVIGVIEVVLYTSGVVYIEETLRDPENKFLYYLALTGVGLIIGLAGFLLAITINHRHLYDSLEQNKE